jgi:hypothetical protein
MISDPRSQPPWDFFHDASIASLQSFELSRLNNAANLHRQIAALLDQWVTDHSEALLASWVREQRALPQPTGSPPEIAAVPHQCVLPLDASAASTLMPAEPSARQNWLAAATADPPFPANQLGPLGTRSALEKFSDLASGLASRGDQSQRFASATLCAKFISIYAPEAKHHELRGTHSLTPRNTYVSIASYTLSAIYTGAMGDRG